MIFPVNSNSKVMISHPAPPIPQIHKEIRLFLLTGRNWLIIRQCCHVEDLFPYFLAISSEFFKLMGKLI